MNKTLARNAAKAKPSTTNKKSTKSSSTKRSLTTKVRKVKHKSSISQTDPTSIHSSTSHLPSVSLQTKSTALIASCASATRLVVSNRSQLLSNLTQNGNSTNSQNTTSSLTLTPKRHMTITAAGRHGKDKNKLNNNANTNASTKDPTKATPLEVEKHYLFLPPQTMDDINERIKEIGSKVPKFTDQELAHQSKQDNTAVVAHPTQKGKYIAPKWHELNPDEVPASLMTPFSSGKFTPNDYGQNPITQAVLSANLQNLHQLLGFEIHEHCNNLARRIKNDPRVQHPLKDIIYSDTSTPENPSFAVRYLISLRDHDGICPLFYSLAQGNIDLPRLLVASGAYLGYEYIVPEAEIGDGSKSVYENALKNSQTTIAQKQHQHDKMVKSEYKNESNNHNSLKPDPSMNDGVPQDGNVDDPNLGQLPFEHEPGNPFLTPVKKNSLTDGHTSSSTTAADPIKIAPLYHTHTVLSMAATFGNTELVEMLLYAGANPNQVLSSIQDQRLAGYVDYLVQQADIYNGQKRLFDVANQIEMEKAAKDRDLDLLDRIGQFYKTQDYYQHSLQISQSYLSKSLRFAKLPKQKFNFDPLIQRQTDMLRYADRTQQKAFYYHQTPLATAVVGGNTSLVELLVAHGADIQFSSYLHGQSLLEIAVYSNNTAALSHLLDGLIALRDPKYQNKILHAANTEFEKMTEFSSELKKNELKSLEPSTVCATRQDLQQFAIDQADAAINQDDPVAKENMKRGILGDVAVYNTEGTEIFVDHSRNVLLSKMFPKPLNLKKYTDLSNVGPFANDYTNLLPTDFQDQATRTIFLDPWKEFTPKYNNIVRIEPYRWAILENLQSKIEDELWNDHIKVIRGEGLDPLSSKSNDVFQMAQEMIPHGFRRTKLSKLEYLTLRGVSVFEQLIDVVETTQYQNKINSTYQPIKRAGVKVTQSNKPVINPSLNPEKQDTQENIDNYNKLLNPTGQSNFLQANPTSSPHLIHQVPQPPLVKTGKNKTALEKVIDELLKGVLSVNQSLLTKTTTPPANTKGKDTTKTLDPELNQSESVIKPALNDSKILLNNQVYTAVSGYPTMYEYHFSSFHVEVAQQELAQATRTNPAQAQVMKQQLEISEPYTVMNEYKRVLNSRMDDWHKNYYQFVQHLHPIYSKHCENVAEVRKLAQLYAVNRKHNWMQGKDAHGNEIPGWNEMKTKFGIVLGQNEFHYQQFLQSLPDNDPQRQFKIQQYLEEQNTTHVMGVQHFISSYLRHKRRYGYKKPFVYQGLGAETPMDSLALPPHAMNWDESFDPTDGFDPQNPDAPLTKEDVNPTTDPYWLLTPFDSGDDELSLDVLGDMSVDDGEYVSQLLKNDPTINQNTIQKLLNARKQQRVYSDQISNLSTDPALTSTLIQFNPALGVDQMEGLLKLDPYWNSIKLTPAMAYFYYVRRRSHIPPDLSTFINFNRLKDIAQHFNKVESLMTLAHYRGGVAVPPNQDQVLIDVDEHTRFGDFDRNGMIEKLDGRYYMGMEMPSASGESLASSRVGVVSKKLSQMDNTQDLKLNEMITQHTLQDQEKRRDEERCQMEIDAKQPVAVNNNIGAQPWQLQRRNGQVEKETLTADRLKQHYTIMAWVSRSHKDGTLSNIFSELGIFENNDSVAQKPLAVQEQTMSFITQQVTPALKRQLESMKVYESQLKQYKNDQEALDLIPVVTKLELPPEIFELIGFFEQIHEAASELRGSPGLAYAIRPSDVDNMDLDPETKQFVKRELSRDQQLDKDQRTIMDNLASINVPELQFNQAIDLATKNLQRNNDVSRVSQTDIDWYKDMGGVTKPYPVHYGKKGKDNKNRR